MQFRLFGDIILFVSRIIRVASFISLEKYCTDYKSRLLRELPNAFFVNPPWYSIRQPAVPDPSIPTSALGL